MGVKHKIAERYEFLTKLKKLFLFSYIRNKAIGKEAKNAYSLNKPPIPTKREAKIRLFLLLNLAYLKR